jgi:hypothetical protein
MRIEYRMDLRCTPWQLWPLLDDPERQKLWLTTLVDFASTSPVPRMVGSTFEFRAREGRRISHYEGRINAYDPPRHLGVSMWGGSLRQGSVMRVDYRVADLGQNCRLEYYAEIDISMLRGPIKLAIPLARLFNFFQLRYFMRNLKRRAEATGRTADVPATAGRGAS